MIDDPRLPWFPCVPTKLLGALSAMKPDQQLVYVIVILRIYEARGPCPDTIDALSRRIGINKRRVTEALDALFHAKKLRTVEGGIMNPVAEGVIARSDALHGERARAGARGGARAAEKRKENQPTPPSKAAAEGKHLHLQEQDSLFPSETGVRKAVGNSGAMKDPPLDAEADLYRRGREVLGASAGGMIRKLLDAKGGNVALTRAAVEQASTRGDAREYVGAMIRPDGRRPSRGGFAAVAKKLSDEEEADAGQIIDAHFERVVAPDEPRGLARLPAGHAR